jgi:hypothetical protein
MLDADYEVAFKKINEEFDSIGHQWYVYVNVKCKLKICGSWYTCTFAMCSCEYLMNIVMMDLQPIFSGFFNKDAW